MIVEWMESGGPAVAPPTAPGFGTTMIIANVESGLDGKLDLDWQADGLRCTFIVPRSNLARPDDRGQPDAAPRPAIVAPHPVPELPRILLVEDESLIAMMMKEILIDLGYQVIGPYARNDDALAAIQQEHIAGAMLDLNVNGEAVYPVADALASRHIPFILVTGYDLAKHRPPFRERADAAKADRGALARASAARDDQDSRPRHQKRRRRGPRLARDRLTTPGRNALEPRAFLLRGH